MKKRAIVSIVLFVSFLLLPITAIMDLFFESYVGEVGKIIHTIAGIVFTLMAIFHIAFNWKTLKSYMKK
ncbi:MAG: hypothetical protein LBD11_03110 [Candidatus Peribacteria bacterium]|jgi:hypothetical protein|nr:hypothetical protein [Candidatus Peribacteria bacterium]